MAARTLEKDWIAPLKCDQHEPSVWKSSALRKSKRISASKISADSRSWIDPDAEQARVRLLLVLALLAGSASAGWGQQLQTPARVKSFEGTRSFSSQSSRFMACNRCSRLSTCTQWPASITSTVTRGFVDVIC